MFQNPLVLGALSLAGTLLGGFAAERFRASDRLVGLSLHAAAGVMFGVVGIELMPRAMEAAHPWAAVVAFFAGGIGSVVLDGLLRKPGKTEPREAQSGSPWGIYVAVGVDLATDGLLIGTGAGTQSRLGLMIALAMCVADAPAGFVNQLSLKEPVPSRVQRIALLLGLAVPLFGALAIGYWLIPGTGLRRYVLAFFAAFLAKAIVEDIMTEAHQIRADSPTQVLSFITGFSAFALMSAYLG